MLVELENWKHLDVYSEVEDKEQVCVSTRWVVTEKYKDGEKMAKARLVARGIEETDLRDIRKDSPTCGKDSLRLCLIILASKHWKISSLDIKAAFLQGKEINREVFLIPPAEANTDKLWQLNKTVYGLSDASRTWYLSVREELTQIGVEDSSYDEAIFLW